MRTATAIGPEFPAQNRHDHGFQAKNLHPLELKSDTRYFITSLEAEERSAARLTQAIRGHLSVENRNHWKRDTSL